MKFYQNQKNDRLSAKAVHKRLIEFVHKIVSGNISRPDFKFICEITGGILFAANLVIRDISVALMENSKAPCTVEKRLSLHLQNPNLFHNINSWLLESMKSEIHVYTPIAIDLTDTQRIYAKKTPGVELNYDGSLNKGGKGYKHLCASAIIPTKNERKIIPIYQDTFGLDEETKLLGEDSPDIDSEFKHFEKCIKSFKQTLGGPIGIDMFDRGGDDKKYFGCELYYNRWFLIRMCDDKRYVWYEGRKYYLKKLLPLIKWHTTKCRVYDKENKQWKKRNRRIGWINIKVEVQYPNGKTELKTLSLVIVRFKKRKMFLLTNFTFDDLEKNIEKIRFAKMLYESYLLRWGIESCFDMLKNRIDIEKIFARTYLSAKNLFALAWLALAFITIAFEITEYITEYLLNIPKRFYKCKIPVCRAFLLFTSLKLLWQRYYISFSFH